MFLWPRLHERRRSFFFHIADARIECDRADPIAARLTLEEDGRFRLRDSTGRIKFAIDPDVETLESELSLVNNAGRATIDMIASEGGDGSQIAMKNAAGDVVIILDTENGGAGQESQISLFQPDGTETVEIAASEGNDGGQIILSTSGGRNSIILDGEYGGVGGHGRVITEVLEITGGADLAEPFDINTEAAATGSEAPAVEPGMVVVLDEANPGELKLATSAYDRKVVGVISGAGGVRPGMLMGQRGSAADGQQPVALTGRVYVWADATFGAIGVGDLLTTSGTPGHVMRASDLDRARGAAIGKAMTQLESGTGLILVLVQPQ